MTTDIDQQQPIGQAPTADQPAPASATQVNNNLEVEETKVLLHSAGAATMNVYMGSSDQAKPKSLDGLADEVPALPGNIHLFRDPRHDQLRAELVRRRILLLASYRESAAYAAAHSLLHDDYFSGKKRRVLLPRRKEGSDLDLLTVTDEQFLGPKSQVVLIEIDSRCPLLDSAVGDRVGPVAIATICNKLEQHDSHVILVVAEDLVSSGYATAPIPCFPVSHLRYVLEHHLGARAEEFERRVLAAVDPGSMEVRELYQHVEARLQDGVQVFEEFVLELERSRDLPLAERREKLQPVTVQDVLATDSEMRRAAAFIGTYFPDIGLRDFDRLVRTLLADRTAPGEATRQIVARDGTVSIAREQEHLSDRWTFSGDDVFSECRLDLAPSADGALIIDFKEPYLRRELRAHFERHQPWYLRRQCQILQESGVLFALDLSPAAVDALVKLFVDRAIIDPVGFGSVWLVDLVQGLRIQLDGTPDGDTREEILAWLLERLAVEAHLRAHFYGRLALLIREMLERESLRRMVREFFEFLIAARQHDALLGVVLDLARHLRFAPHFDPLVWIRRLLDQGSALVRERTAFRLIALARESGPRIYEFMAVVRNWLPEATRTPDRFSVSNKAALRFPFAYCLSIAKTLPEDRFGQWPSHHPLFYALPTDPAEARREIRKLVEWILDPRGVALATDDEEDPTLTAEANRIADVGDLIEHWAWVLEGALNEGHPDGRALFRLVTEEINVRLGAHERTLLQRSWQRRQDAYIADAIGKPVAERTPLINRRVRLEQVRKRFAQSGQAAGGTAP